MIQASIYFNGDDCFIAWSMPILSDCWGFAIYRKLERNGKLLQEGFLQNRTGFEKDKNPPDSHKSSEEWPFQRYTWTDHGVDEGDTVTYTIYPVVMKQNALITEKASGKVLGPVTVSAKGAGKCSAYFNRGLILSQFMARELVKTYGKDWTKDDLLKMKSSLKNDDSKLRDFLMGQLGKKLLSLLKEAKQNSWHVYAALYELDDEALITELKSLGQNAHLVLSNGSEKKVGSDGNKEAAQELNGAIDLNRRMLWSEGLGHNKFVVFAKSPNDPFMVWTGSLNWATTGLCTQLNNGILIEDDALAVVYRDQWELLKNDKRTGRNGREDMHFGDKLMTSNNKIKSGSAVQTGNWNVWFTRTSEGQDLQFATDLINRAKDAILFLMFEPGNNGLLQVIQSRLSPASRFYNDKLYLHGVVNTFKPGSSGKTLSVDLVGRGKNKPFDLDVVQPEGVNLSDFAVEIFQREVQRDDFMMPKGVIGHAIIHSKIVVLDPFTNPVVITGSHNFSSSASKVNDENLIIISGNKELAERYCVNIMATYQHYRWRAYLKECEANGTSPWQGLKKSAEWQDNEISKNKELQFWIRQ
jgi:hypothetical protein